VLAVHGRNSSGAFLIYELVIPARITIYPVEGECWQSADKNLPVGNNSRIPSSEGSLPHKHNFFKIKHENVIKMKLNCLDFHVLKGQSHDKVCLCKILWLPLYDAVVCGNILQIG
jgi:hypothetical protein